MKIILDPMAEYLGREKAEVIETPSTFVRFPIGDVPGHHLDVRPLPGGIFEIRTASGRLTVRPDTASAFHLEVEDHG